MQYDRSHPRIANLLGIVRLRGGNETPQYIAHRATWDEATTTYDFRNLSGFYDSSSDLLHYFSVGRLPDTQKMQKDPKLQAMYKPDTNEIHAGAGFAFKHQQMLELVPFFVRDDVAPITLCRAVHYLRTSPAWRMSNLGVPYPMHLGDRLIDDYLCVLANTTES